MNKFETSAVVSVSKQFRRLESHELVRAGDFVNSERREFELFDGLSGFRAGSFVKPIYRKTETVRPLAKNVK